MTLGAMQVDKLWGTTRCGKRKQYPSNRTASLLHHAGVQSGVFTCKHKAMKLWRDC